MSVELNQEENQESGLAEQLLHPVYCVHYTAEGGRSPAWPTGACVRLYPFSTPIWSNAVQAMC